MAYCSAVSHIPPQVLHVFPVPHARCCARSCKQQMGKGVHPGEGYYVKVQKIKNKLL